MGRLKRGRKIRSGNKMVRKALDRQKLFHLIELQMMASIFCSQIGIITAQKMFKSGALKGDIIKHCDEEIILPVKDIAEKFKEFKINKINRCN